MGTGANDGPMTAKAVADRLGVTVKSLRVLERHALMAPARTEGGWRVYRKADLERLYEIRALRAYGLSLSDVAKLLSGKDRDVAALLALQEKVLTRQTEDASQALRLVRKARQSLRQGASLSTDDLINLIKETTMSETKSPAVDALIERHYSPAQRQALAERSFTPADQTAVEAAWNDIYAEAARLADDGADPGGEPALALARRAQSLIEAFTQRDQGLDASLQAFWEEAQSKPEVMAAMPGTAQSRAFLGAAQAALRSREAG